jgi:HK97 family phage portal protein
VTLLAGLFDRRSIENPAVPLTSTSLVEWLDSGQKTDAGVTVTETKALNIAAVWRAVNMTAGVASALPLKTYRLNTRKRVVVRLLDNPHPDMTSKELWETVYVHLLLWGNAYLLKVRNPAGMLSWLIPIPPSTVKVGRVKDWQQAGMTSPKVYEVTGFTDGSTESWTDYEVLHIPGLGYDGVLGLSPISVARQSLGTTLAADSQAGKQWASGAMLQGILQSDQKLDQDRADAIKARWRKMMNTGQGRDVAVLGSGVTFQPVSMPNDDAQFLESRIFQVSEVCRWFGMPPHMNFEVSGSTSWGTGIEQMTIGWVKYTLAPSWLSRVESRLTKEATPAGTYAEYDTDGLMRGDSSSQAAYYAQASGRPWMSLNEVRVKQNLPPVPGGDDVLVPLNYAPTSDGTSTDPTTGQTAGDANADAAA